MAMKDKNGERKKSANAARMILKILLTIVDIHFPTTVKRGTLIF